MMNSIKYLLCVFSLLLVVSCTKDQDDDSVGAPTDFYYTGNQPVPFYTEGSTGAPNINWNNNVGTFALQSNYTGVTIDATTGVVSWNKDLPLGTNTIGVKATNTGGEATTTVIFLHQFSGNFKGGFNTNPSSTTVTASNLDITFNVDGTASVTDSGSTVNGSWSFLTNGKLSCNYTVSGTAYELLLDLTYSVTVIPKLEGFKKVSGSATNLGYVKIDYQLP